MLSFSLVVGDYERQLDLPITAMCDRYSDKVPDMQQSMYYYLIG